MTEINGNQIELGQTVKTTQQSGGLIPPAKSQTGEVVLFTFDGSNRLAIKYRKETQNFYRHILLEGKINEIIK
jgi:hypothetical protein